MLEFPNLRSVGRMTVAALAAAVIVLAAGLGA